VHAAGANLVVSTSPVPLGMLKAPGAFGADVVTAEGQSLGVPQSFGGPYVGLLATKQSFVRQMPGRLAGITTDSEGKRGFVLALQTREQHIRREKATSNICTNQGLMATAATVYMSTMGPEGFKEVAERSYQNAHYLADQISGLTGYVLPVEAPFFHEFIVSCPKPVREINPKLAEAGYVGGYDLGLVDPAFENFMLICATELQSKATIDEFVALLAGA
jgi:glycine dehydrogenase subunit 1